MNKPSGFSLSSLSVSLAKIPKTYLYGAAGAVLLGALSVVALNMLNTPPADEFTTPVVSTPTTAPGTTSDPQATANPSTSTGATPVSNPSGSDDIGGGPSRSLEVAPIPFLVTEAIKNDPNNPNATQATTQAINTRAASSAVVNPFAPLTVENTGNIGVVQNGNTPNLSQTVNITRPPVVRSTPAVRQPGIISIQRPQPLPQFPTAPQGSKPTQATLPPRSGSVKIIPATKNTPTSVPKIPKAIANAKPAIKAPKPGIGSPSSSVALSSPAPTTPGLMRQVVPAKPAPVQPVQPVDPVPTVIPATPTDPELTGDYAALTEPNILGGPIELREPSAASIATPSPLDSSIPKAPVKPPVVTPPDTTVPVEQPPVVVPMEKIDPLTAFVNARGLSFVGVVLGPVNTAIFETKEGTVVVPLGATLPQSDVIIKTITADQVVLMQGQDTIILSRAK